MMEKNEFNQKYSEHEALNFLKQFYGYNSFRPMQWDIISNVLNGNDTFALMPTGGGKSMCFQIPALMLPGCAIVVSPLLALMKDQVDSLRANGIPAASISSTQSEAENREIIDNVFNGKIKLLYLSPEKLLNECGLWSRNMKISLIAIDEAHCISQWGHDFRPEYSQLAILKERFVNVPIIALTATADKLTRQDIIEKLDIRNAKVFISSFDRPNISLNVITNSGGQTKQKQIIQFIERHRNESGIIYCLSRKTCEKLAKSLQNAGYKAKAFHAMLPTDVKEEIQQGFSNDEITIICATVAFGMGIDKSNVRWVIHYNMPKNIESYYQEIGRAGRDGMPAEALMFYSYADVISLTKFAKESGQVQINFEKLSRMQQYAESTICRRRSLLNYFNEPYNHDCQNCDICRNPPERIDGTILAQMALSAIVRTHEQIGFNMTIDILRGARKNELLQNGYNQLPTYGVGHEYSYSQWNSYLLQMLHIGLFEIAYDNNKYLKLTQFGNSVLRGKAQIYLAKFVFKQTKTEKKSAQTKEVIQDRNDLFELLRKTRLAVAHSNHIAPYMVFSDKTLNEIANVLPTNKAQFSTIYGVGTAKLEKYWKIFTDAVIEYINKK